MVDIFLNVSFIFDIVSKCFRSPLCNIIFNSKNVIQIIYNIVPTHIYPSICTCIYNCAYNNTSYRYEEENL